MGARGLDGFYLINGTLEFSNESEHQYRQKLQATEGREQTRIVRLPFL